LKETGLLGLGFQAHKRAPTSLLAKGLISASMAAVVACGQSLRVIPSQTDLKTPGVFSLSMDSPSGKAPAALQWEFSVPPVIAISVADITVGQAAESAHKLLTCAIKTNKSPVQRRTRLACILAGGLAPIPNGPVAVVHYRVQWEVGGAPIRIGVENILGASADPKPTPIRIPGVDQIIEIRQEEHPSRGHGLK
jgi:hypothetical protein